MEHTRGNEKRRHKPVGQEQAHSQRVLPPDHHTQPHAERLRPKGGVTVFMDHKPYTIARYFVTAAELRNLSSPPVGADRDVFRVSSGRNDDLKIGEADLVEVHLGAVAHGRHFYSAGRAIADSTSELAKRAYFIYMNGGCQHGHDVEHWLAAEKEIASLKTT